MQAKFRGTFNFNNYPGKAEFIVVYTTESVNNLNKKAEKEFDCKMSW